MAPFFTTVLLWILIFLDANSSTARGYNLCSLRNILADNVFTVSLSSIGIVLGWIYEDTRRKIHQRI